MKIIRKNKIIDLNKFETVRYCSDPFAFSPIYDVEAMRRESGILGSNLICENIARICIEDYAKKLVADISSAWIAGENSFNVDEWIVAQENDRCRIGENKNE